VVADQIQLADGEAGVGVARAPRQCGDSI
jgi:hypothetical protein